MIYAAVYFGVGLLVLIGIALDNFVRGSRGASDWRKLADQIRRAGRSRIEALLEGVIIPFIAAVAIVVAWPAALVFVVHFYRRRTTEEEEDGLGSFERRTFTVEHCHLLHPITLPDIECREMIADPLNAVPAKPFGHLNPAWLEFRSHVRATDRIWSFEAEWGDFGRHTEVRSGYALVRDDSVVFYFTKGIRPIPTTLTGR